MHTTCVKSWLTATVCPSVRLFRSLSGFSIPARCLRRRGVAVVRAPIWPRGMENENVSFIAAADENPVVVAFLCCILHWLRDRVLRSDCHAF
jgi:hypothetical protein